MLGSINHDGLGMPLPDSILNQLVIGDPRKDVNVNGYHIVLPLKRPISQNRVMKVIAQHVDLIPLNR